MARRPSSRPGVRLGALAIIVVAMYSGMFGSSRTSPPLGLDLQGGTTLTLTPQATNGIKPTKGQLDVAVDIIRQRVDGLGVSGATVVTQGNDVVISVPGKGRSEVLDQVGQTAALSFREIYTNPANSQPAEANNPTPSASAAPTGTASPKTSVSVSSGAGITIAPSSPAAGASAASPPASGSAHNRPLASALLASPGAGTTGASASPSASPSASTAPSAAATASGSNAGATPVPSLTATATPSASPSGPPGSYEATQLAAEQACVQSLPTGAADKADQTTPSPCTIATFNTLDCSKNSGRPLYLDEDPHHYVIACDRTGLIKYLLTPAQILGTAVSGATATIGTTSQGISTGVWEVDVTFKDSAVNTVTSVSTKLFQNNEQQLAITLDGVVEAAPSTDAVLSKNISITGSSANPFTEGQANDLANALKYGSLPVAFTRSTAETVSATLGHSSLNAGLLAGAIGLALVLVYVFFYYRMLGFVTVASLVTSGLLVYASITLLGAAIGYTLSLPGIAGLIVSIGITADSFVVFFERIKDEMREGRSPRLAVEYGWARARRTIFTADTVSFLAAVILYIVSVGDVKGFAFTLGLSTFLDIVVVLLFTKPFLTLLIRFPLFSTSTKSGISAGRVGRRVAPREA